MTTNQPLSVAAVFLATVLTFLTACSGFAADKPVIVQYPVSQTLQEGGTLTLDVTATGDLPIVYTWRRNGFIKARSTNEAHTSTFVLPNIQTNQAGLYDVWLLNAAGSCPALKKAYVTVLRSGVQSNQYTLGLTGYADTTYRLEETTDLAGSTNWQTVTNVTLPASAHYQHTAPTGTNRARFYRVIPPEE